MCVCESDSSNACDICVYIDIFLNILYIHVSDILTTHDQRWNLEIQYQISKIYDDLSTLQND